MTSSRVRIALITMLALHTSGCLRPWLKRLENTPAVRPTPALLVGMVARFDGPGTLLDVAQAVSSIPTDTVLGDFGKYALGPLSTALDLHGYTLTFDQERVASIDALAIEPHLGASRLTPPWRHPETSAWTPDTVDALQTRVGLISWIRKNLDPLSVEYFAFVSLDINDVGNLFREPVVIARMTVYDASALKVLDVRGVGTGATSLLFADRSPANLRLAFDDAMASLMSVSAAAL